MKLYFQFWAINLSFLLLLKAPRGLPKAPGGSEGSQRLPKAPGGSRRLPEGPEGSPRLPKSPKDPSHSPSSPTALGGPGVLKGSNRWIHAAGLNLGLVLNPNSLNFWWLLAHSAAGGKNKHHSPSQANDLRFNDMPPSPNNLDGGMVPYIELLACSDGEALNLKLP